MAHAARALDAPLRSLCALACGLGALQFMLVQPLVGQVLLPQFGGAPGVWVPCLAFFQLLLFVGYVAAHLMVRRLSLGAQLLAVSAMLLAVIVRGPLLLPQLPEQTLTAPPTWVLLAFLFQHVAPSGLVLATTTPLMQAWYVAATGCEPYVLFAFSNVGSILGLLAYPLLLEPWLGLAAQRQWWSVGFCAYALLILTVVAAVWRGLEPARVRPSSSTGNTPSSLSTSGVARTTPREVALWFALSAAPSALLAAVSNHITIDVPAGPLLWLAPLALYLGSFVLTFSREARRASELHAWLWIVCTVALPILLMPGNDAPLSILIGVPLLTLWTGAVLCHGQLAARRPSPDRLTTYYGCLAAGGAAGGGSVAFVAPTVFADHYELALSMLAIHGLLLALSRRRNRREAPSPVQRLAWLGFGLAVPLLIATLCVQFAGLGRAGHLLARSRNFFGPLQVTDTARLRVLTYGRTDQGHALRDAAHRLDAVGYYGPETGVSRALRLHAPGRARKLGVIGLGVGALASHARAGDDLRFYEINPDVEVKARRWFDFLEHTKASLTIVLGDGRLALQREPPHAFDVLVLDAFSSDSVPVHLLTREAFDIYLRQLAPDGLLLVNASNRHVRVDSVVVGSARQHELACVVLQGAPDAARGVLRSRWVLMARNRALLEPLLDPPITEVPAQPVFWSDDHHGLLSVVR